MLRIFECSVSCCHGNEEKGDGDRACRCALLPMKENEISVITMRVPIGVFFVKSSARVVLPERVLPFLPPGLSPTSRICVSLSMSPALRKALLAMDLVPGTGAEVEKRDIYALWL